MITRAGSHRFHSVFLSEQLSLKHVLSARRRPRPAWGRDARADAAPVVRLRPFFDTMVRPTQSLWSPNFTSIRGAVPAQEVRLTETQTT